MSDTDGTSSKELLRRQEKRISAAFLKHSPKERSLDEGEEGILQVFLETVAGVHEIVTSRLYRCQANSLEAYFNSRWGISRAQVYRYMDCFFVLNQLHGFAELPARERLCRSLKKLAKTESDMRKLWEFTLVLAGQERPIPTQLIHDAWNRLKKGKKIEPQTEQGRKRSHSENSVMVSPAPSKRLRTLSQNSEPTRPRTSSQGSESLKRTSSHGSDRKFSERSISIDDLLNEAEAEFLVGEGRTLEPEAYEPDEVREYLEETTKDEAVDELVKSLFSTMDALGEIGYKLQPKIDHRWYPVPIKQWRMIPTDTDMDIEIPSLVRPSSDTIPTLSSDNYLQELE
jgi:hypothetical protein